MALADQHVAVRKDYSLDEISWVLQYRHHVVDP
jgi:hypothetical protein